MKQILITIAAVVLVGCGPSASDISIHDAAAGGHIKAIKQHLAAGTNVNAKDVNEWTPLHQAASDKEITKVLIENGADVNAKNEEGLTALHEASFSFADDDVAVEIVELLIAKGADVNAQDDDGSTPLDAAIDGDITETADLLRKHGGKTKKELEAAGN